MSLRWLLRIGVSAALFWLLLRHQDGWKIVSRIFAVAPSDMLAAILLFFGIQIVVALRWSTILHSMGQPVTLRVTVPLQLISFFLGETLPASMGDGVRAWYAHKAGVPGGVALASVVIDRVAGLAMLFFVVMFALPALFSRAPEAQIAEGVFLLSLSFLVALGAMLAFDFLPEGLQRYSVARWLAQLSIEARKLVESPKKLSIIFLSGLANQLGCVVIALLVARGLDSHVSAAVCVIVFPLANLMQSLPVSIAGWGVREGFFIWAFGLVGMHSADAFSISLLYGLVRVMVSLPGGVIWLTGRSRCSLFQAGSRA